MNQQTVYPASHGETAFVEIPLLRRDKKEEERRRKAGFASPWFSRAAGGGGASMGGAGSGGGLFGFKVLGGFAALSSGPNGLGGSLPFLALAAGLVTVGSLFSLWDTAGSGGAGSVRGWKTGSLAAPAGQGRASGGRTMGASLDYLRYANPGSESEAPAVPAPAPASSPVPQYAPATASEAPPLPPMEFREESPVPIPNPSDQLRDAVASAGQLGGGAPGQLSQALGAGSMGVASFGSVSNKVGSFAPGLGSAGFRKPELKGSKGRLGAMRRSPVPPLSRARSSRRLPSRAFGQLRDIAGNRPQFAGTQTASFAQASAPFDAGRVAGTAKGLSDGGPGIVASPSAENSGGSSFGGAGPNPNANVTQPPWADDQPQAQEKAKSGTGMMMIAMILFLLALLILLFAKSAPPWLAPVLIAIGMMIMMMAMMQSQKGKDQGQQTKDKGQNLQNHGQESAGDSANQMGDAIQNSGDLRTAGTKAEQDVQKAADEQTAYLNAMRQRELERQRQMQLRNQEESAEAARP